MTEPAKLTREAFDAAVAQLSKYGSHRRPPDPIHPRRWAMYDADTIELGIRKKGDPLTMYDIGNMGAAFMEYDRFLRYLASMGWRPTD